MDHSLFGILELSLERRIIINKVHFRLQVDNPTSYLDLQNTDRKLLNRLIDLYLLFGIKDWFITDELSYPIPSTWVESIDRKEKTLVFSIPNTLNFINQEAID